MKLDDLRSRLDDLKKKKTIAQTKEQLLNEEKEKLLVEVNQLLTAVKTLNILPEEELTSHNLTHIVDMLATYIDDEISKSTIPPELL